MPPSSSPRPRARSEIETTPPGASGTVNGEPLDRPTPVRALNVPSGLVKIHLELPGYVPLDYELEVLAAQTIIDRQRFVPLPATVQVTTEPTGVQVTLGGRVLGTTPLTRSELVAEPGVSVTLSRAGYESQTFKIDLEPGQTATINRTLKQAQKFALAQLQIKGGGWGDVFLGGKLLGRAPLRQVRLPVGQVTLQLVNDGDKQRPLRWTVTCEITETGPNVCATSLPSP